MLKKILRNTHATGEVEEYDEDKVPASGNQIFMGHNQWAVGSVSEACGMHTSQVKEFREDVERAGIRGVEIQSNGSVKFGSRAARRKYMEFRGLYDRDAGYSDAVPTQF